MPRRRMGGAVIGLLGVALVASAQWAGETVALRAPVDHDVYAAGGEVSVTTRLGGDIAAAGQQVVIDGEVIGDVMAAGETVRLRGQFRDDVRVAGREVIVAGQVADHLVAAGASVTLAPEAVIGQWAWMAGGRVDVAGRIAGPVRIAAGSARIRGEVGGDLEVVGDDIVLVRGAHVGGDLVWQGSQAPRIETGARVDGQIIERPLSGMAPGAPGAPQRGGWVAAGAVIVAAIVLYLLFPGVAARSAATFRSAPWKTLGLGLAILAATPLVMGVLFATVVGALLALGLLAAYLLALLLGFLLGVYCLADLGLRSVKRDDAGKPLRALALALAVLLLALVQLVPIAGGLLALLVLLYGLGALNLAAYRGYAGAS